LYPILEKLPTYLFTLLLVSGCIVIPNKLPISEIGLRAPFEPLSYLEKKDLSLYTFELRETSLLGDTYGKAFIAECNIYTAKHVIEVYDRIGYDVVNLGPTPVYGFSLCREDHGENNSFVYVSSRGLIEMWVQSENDISFEVFCSDNIKPGDSGTPEVS